jgi:hypothetical protein
MRGGPCLRRGRHRLRIGRGPKAQPGHLRAQRGQIARQRLDPLERAPGPRPSRDAEQAADGNRQHQ